MRVLLLAGTTEARHLAAALRAMPGVEVLASLAGVTRVPQDLGVPTRIGGFGGDDGFRRTLQEGGFDAVIDATHPFAQKITERAGRLCAEEGVPCVHLLRPAWVPEARDRWTMIGDESEAAAVIPEGARVFVATGRQTLDRLANMGGRHLFVRQIDSAEGAFPFAQGEYLVGRAPFSVEAEVALFRRHAIDWLVVKNAGGPASWPKLAAARDLGLPVAMVRRPPPPTGPVVASPEAALDWLRALP